MASALLQQIPPTLSDLVTKVLNNLGVLDAGQPVAAEDADQVLSILSPKIEELNARDIGFIDIDNLQDSQFLALADILAYSLIQTFNIFDQTRIADLSRRGGINGEAEGILKDVVRLRTPRQTMRCEIFNRPYRRYGRNW